MSANVYAIDSRRSRFYYANKNKLSAGELERAETIGGVQLAKSVIMTQLIVDSARRLVYLIIKRGVDYELVTVIDRS
jgi:hypothetical protein